MRAVVQRVSRAAVSVEDEIVGQIGPGLLVLLGVTHDDDPKMAAAMAEKVARLRILRDGNRDESAAVDLTAPVLVVSQFTLYADTNRGRRPSWSAAAPAAIAEPLVAAFVHALAVLGLPVQTGRFGATMAIDCINDGPLTILLESP
jgi:D-tyrosyl-tRNA(Tyr) deacylase